MSFNLKNNKKVAQNKPYPKRLVDDQKELGESIGSDTDSYQGRLEGTRGEGQGSTLDSVTEGQMGTSATGSHTNDDSLQPITTEGQMGAATDSYVPHRDPNIDDHVMKPMDALAEAHHQKHRQAYLAMEDDGETEFWDKQLGVQQHHDYPKKTTADPASASQLPNRPERFESLASQPTEVDVDLNAANANKKDKVKKLQAASIKDIDEALFDIFYKAASEDRELTDDEADDVIEMSHVKASMLSEIQKISEKEE